MQLSEIQSKIYDLTGTDSTSYPNAKMAIDLNIWQNRVVSHINLSQDESDHDDPNWGDYPMNTSALSTDRSYFVPQSEKVISFKNVDITYDGVNWVRATPLDTNELTVAFPPSSYTTAEAQLDALFSKTNPRYDVKYNAAFIYPKPSQEDVDAGGLIKMEWAREAKDITAAEITTGTKIPGFDTTFHPILAYGPAWEFNYSKQKFALADRAKIELDVLLKLLEKQYGSKQKDRGMAVTANEDIYNGYK